MITEYQLSNMSVDDLAQIMFQNFSDLTALDYEARMIHKILDERGIGDKSDVFEKFQNLIFDSMREYDDYKK